jgi:hypothetical protein
MPEVGAVEVGETPGAVVVHGGQSLLSRDPMNGYARDVSDRDQLQAQLSEARLRLNDLTRELDESMAAEEHDEHFTAKLQRARECVLELVEALEALSG